MPNEISAETFLNRNLQLKNSHLGERCFILGNGPSLKTVDFSLLADEFVFTVNFFSFIEGFEKVKTNVHVVVDLAAFNAVGESNDVNFNKVIENFLNIGKQNPIVFIDLEGLPFMQQTGLTSLLNLHYLLRHGTILDNQISIELDKPITSYWNVVQYAIVIAIYMGFKEIYLLGCDGTSVIGTINSALGRSQFDFNLHAYDDEKEERNENIKSPYSLSHCFFCEYCYFLAFEKLFYLCDKVLNVKLVNCSSLTMIDSIPRADLSTILNNKGGGYCNNSILILQHKEFISFKNCNAVNSSYGKAA